ncbi:hypothetical protein CPB85DRAFT_1268067 [Mucidula mucida]|nr:hypothetical protein CPB85DRAFT_1268067 [Mucidula mucida]
MVSLMSLPALDEKSQFQVPLNELGNLHDAVEPFTQVLLRLGPSVKLHCAVPTWCPTSETCLDLHDLHELRSRLLLFIHDLVQSLRACGVHASYSLAPSNSSMCLVCASGPDIARSQVKTCAIDVLQNAKLSKREHAVLADLKSYPSLIIT